MRPEAVLARKMSTLRRRDTAPELALRRELHGRGLRYRLQVKAPGNRRRTIDICFRRRKVAVSVDGCFWHGCPVHHHRPRANATWWDWKIASNRARDADCTRALEAQGWTVVRVWEHEDPVAAADRVCAALGSLR
ncbi:very short patch repair endonuclease [Rhodococcus aerolatus]